MTCLHSRNDPDCSAYRSAPRTPDAEKYSVEEIQQVGPHLVMMVKYPNCSNCSYEGNKVMVFLDFDGLQATKWKKIDPHFRDPKAVLPSEAPSPAARFPGNKAGWQDAIDYATSKII